MCEWERDSSFFVMFCSLLYTHTNSPLPPPPRSRVDRVARHFMTRCRLAWTNAPAGHFTSLLSPNYVPPSFLSHTHTSPSILSSRSPQRQHQFHNITPPHKQQRTQQTGRAKKEREPGQMTLEWEISLASTRLDFNSIVVVVTIHTLTHTQQKEEKKKKIKSFCVMYLNWIII